MAGRALDRYITAGLFHPATRRCKPPTPLRLDPTMKNLIPLPRFRCRRTRLNLESLEERRTPVVKVAVVSSGGVSNDIGFSATAAQLNDDTYFDFSATMVSASQVDTTAELAAYDVVVIGNSGFTFPAPVGDPFDNLTFTT